MKAPFRHVESDLSIDTALAAAQVHRQAQEGKAIGTAMVVMYEGGFFHTSVAGECHRSPIWTLGAVAILNTKLRRIAEEDHGGID